MKPPIRIETIELCRADSPQVNTTETVLIDADEIQQGSPDKSHGDLWRQLQAAKKEIDTLTEDRRKVRTDVWLIKELIEMHINCEKILSPLQVVQRLEANSCKQGDDK
jgi:hypothetical protein